MSLLARGTIIASGSYSQETIYRRQTRQHIAHVILSTSEIPVPLQIIGGRLPQAASFPLSTSLSPPRQHKAYIPQKASKAYRKRGKRVTRMATYTEDQPTTATTLLNRKRTELSLAMDSNPNEISQRQISEQRTKRKGAEELPRMTKFQKK